MTTILALLTPNYADWEFGLLAAAARGYCEVEVLTASPDGDTLPDLADGLGHRVPSQADLETGKLLRRLLRDQADALEVIPLP